MHRRISMKSITHIIATAWRWIRTT